MLLLGHSNVLLRLNSLLQGGPLFRGQTTQGYPTEKDVYFDPDIPALGNPKGDVTIAEFFDYQCPYCKRNHPELMKVIESDGRIRLVMKDFPIFGDPSIYAANLVLASAAAGKYAAALEALMNTPARLSRQDVDATLKKVGLDPTELHAAYPLLFMMWLQRAGECSLST